MVRHLVRHVVKVGEGEHFTAAAAKLNAAASAAGLPVYRFYDALWGDLNEVWSEADYESVEAHLRGLKAAGPEFRNALRSMLSHTVEGSVHDYMLEERSLG